MSNLLFNEGAAPSTPAADKLSLYASTDGMVRAIDDKGNNATLHNNTKYNFIRNSGFWFAQRQDPSASITYSNTSGRAFTADGWAVTNENASMTFFRSDARSAPETGLHAPFYGNFTKTTSNGKLAVSQCIESTDAAHLKGRQVRITLDLLRINSDINLRVGVLQLTTAGTADTLPATFISAFNANGADPTWGTNLALIAPKAGHTPQNGTVSGSAVTVAVNSTWKTVSFVIDVPTDCENLIPVIWSDTQVTANSGFKMSSVMLTEGEDVQDWQPLSIGNELLRIQRFYSKSFETDDRPVAAQGVGNGEFSSMVGKAGATALAFNGHVRYPVAMFKVPTITTFNPTTAANSNPRRYTGAAAADFTAVATANISTRSFEITATGDAGGAVGDRASVHWTADGEL